MSARRSLIAGLGTLAAALLLAFGFQLIGLSLADPQVIAQLSPRAEFLSFAFWTLPLAALVGWVGGRWNGGRGTFAGVAGALCGAILGGAYAYAMLILTNTALLAFHFPLLWTWVFAAGLALLVTWTPPTKAARLVSAPPIIAAIAWIISDAIVSSRPASLLKIDFRPGATQAERVEFERSVIGIPGPRGFDLLPGVSGSGSDSSSATLRFSPHASGRDRSDAERRALSSPLVAGIRWFTPAETESMDAAQVAAFEAALRADRAVPREAIILWYKPNATPTQRAGLEQALVDVPGAGEEVRAVARAGIHIEALKSVSDTTIAFIRFDPDISDLWRGRVERQARESPLVARTAWAKADEVAHASGVAGADPLP